MWSSIEDCQQAIQKCFILERFWFVVINQNHERIEVVISVFPSNWLIITMCTHKPLPSYISLLYGRLVNNNASCLGYILDYIYITKNYSQSWHYFATYSQNESIPKNDPHCVCIFMSIPLERIYFKCMYCKLSPYSHSPDSWRGPMMQLLSPSVNVKDLAFWMLHASRILSYIRDEDVHV